MCSLHYNTKPSYISLVILENNLPDNRHKAITGYSQSTEKRLSGKKEIIYGLTESDSIEKEAILYMFITISFKIHIEKKIK